MIARKLTGLPSTAPFPKGAVDTQMHMYLPGYPALPGGPGLPQDPLPDAAAYRQVMDWMGVDRVIITQGNAHQKDNGNLLACLDEMRDCAWGVAVIDGKTDDRQMAELSARRVVGARIMDLPGGALNLDHLEEVDARAHAAGWMMAVQFNGSDILTHLPRLMALKSRWVLDHHGKFFRGAAPDAPQVDAVLQLIDKGNCWFKFAGVYESSQQGWPFADIEGLSRRIAAHAPERIVWGTNWPHNGIARTEDYPDEIELAELVLDWLPEGARDRVLVSNPEELYRIPPV
ncbi:amidohydrolase family protein [Paracoccus sp. CPCC 101403]|uniref:Amidohydrolase family protein n=1 Tax=Paracoccus broussonetiae TaxID=3075834 RepID=A0ABU3EHN4_9RHOB|nr:amidohydrolase family protein [Paracoccus sp. CPCC 101403]MDT1063625.1 amidohydrolase family protein [Paracoccus sp. CPCC 101403]